MPSKATTSRSGSAFTLIELLVVIAVIVLLAAILLAGLARTVGTARSVTAQRSIDALVIGVNQFKAEFGFLPPLVHDGPALSAGDPNYRAGIAVAGQFRREDGPVVSNPPPFPRGSAYEQLVVWSEVDPRYFGFIRRRSGEGSDPVLLPQGGAWNIAHSWEDRRYSKFALPYYLYGVGGQRLDGVAGPGMTRPLANGLFEGALLSGIGGTRDRFQPVIDADRRSLRLIIGYRDEGDYAEHGATPPPAADIPDSHAAFIDPWGRAVRYYRWEPGRLDGGQLVVRTTLDLNIPPVLINPEIYAAVRNQDNSDNARQIDLTAGSPELRAARYAVVSAGPDGLFGTEPIEYIAEQLGRAVPTTEQEIIRLRKEVWEDNLVGLGN